MLLVKAWEYLSRLKLMPILKLGKASYHIFLVQIVYFAFLPYTPSNVAVRLVMNIVVCCLVGLAFQEVEQRLLRMLKGFAHNKSVKSIEAETKISSN
jgi:peptidoglycan/LPS O-acetylase OafA/YrhL